MMRVRLEVKVDTVEYKDMEETTELEDYQTWVNEVTEFQGDARAKLVWSVIGLGSEAGEVQGEVEKLLRKNEPVSKRHDIILDELGDVLWYAASVCNALGITLDEVIEHNIQKINKRVYESEAAKQV